MKRKKLLKLIVPISLVVVLAVGLPLMSGCIPAPGVTPEVTPSEAGATELVRMIQSIPFEEREPILIGVPITLTGVFAADGQSIYQAAVMAEEDINAAGGVLMRPIKNIYFDIEDMRAEKLMAAAEYLCERMDVSAILCGWTGAGADVEAFGRFDQPFLKFDTSKIVVDMVKDNPELYSNVFELGDYEEPYGRKYIEQLYMITEASDYEFLNNKVAIIHSDFEMDRGLAEGYKWGLEDRGWEVVMDELVPFDVMDFGPLLSKIRAMDPAPAIIHYESTSPVDFVTFFRQFLENPTQSLVTQGWGYGIVGGTEVMGAEGDGVIGESLCYPFTGAVEEWWFEKWEARWGPPRVVNTIACTYVTYQVWSAAAQRVGDDRDFAAVCEAIKKHPIISVKAIYDMDRPGQYMSTGPNLPFTIFQTRDGKRVTLMSDIKIVGEFIKPWWLE